MFGALKKLINLLFLFGGILIIPLLNGCTNEFQVSLEGDDIPVVYCIVNPKDSIYYVKLTKSFTCSQSVIPCSMDTANLFYKDPQLSFEVLTPDGRLLDRGNLHPVIIPNPDTTSRLFNPTSKIVYAISRNEITIDNWNEQERILVLKIAIPEYPKLVVARTSISQPFELLNPKIHPQGTRLDFFTSEGQSITWWGPENECYEGKFIFHYTDYLFPDSAICHSVNFSFNGTEPKISSLEWKTFTYRLYGEAFLDSIARCFRKIPKVDSLMYRKLDSVDIELSSASYDYYSYIYALHYDSDVEIKQTYNIENGYGLFASKRQRLSTGNYLNHNTLDSLANSPKTRWINFVIWE